MRSPRRSRSGSSLGILSKLPRRNGSSAGVEQIVGFDPLPRQCPQPAFDLLEAARLQQGYPLPSSCVAFLRLEAAAIVEPPEDQFGMSLADPLLKLRSDRFVCLAQLIPDTPQLNRNSRIVGTPIVAIGLLMGSERPNAPARAEKDPRADQLSSFDVASTIALFRKPEYRSSRARRRRRAAPAEVRNICTRAPFFHPSRRRPNRP
jgi:hypothetical protein